MINNLSEVTWSATDSPICRRKRLPILKHSMNQILIEDKDRWGNPFDREAQEEKEERENREADRADHENQIQQDLEWIYVLIAERNTNTIRAIQKGAHH